VNRCNEKPLWGENADFRPVSKFKYWLTLCDVLPVKKDTKTHGKKDKVLDAKSNME